jgi:hypothetical protein
MQNEYASYQFTQSIGSVSCVPAAIVHVSAIASQARFVSVGAMLMSSVDTQPGS